MVRDVESKGVGYSFHGTHMYVPGYHWCDVESIGGNANVP